MRPHRIELTTESSGCCAALCGDITVKVKNRNLPAHIHMASRFNVGTETDDEYDLSQEAPSWENFFDEIDEALKPLSDLRKRTARALFSCLCLTLILLAATPFILGDSLMRGTTPNTIDNNDENRTNNGDRDSDLQYMVMALGFFFMIPFVVICYLVNSAKRRDLEINAKLGNICREASCQNPDVRFSLRHQIRDGKRTGVVRYIQVKVISATAESSMENGEERTRPRTPDTVCSYISDEENDVIDAQRPVQFF